MQDKGTTLLAACGRTRQYIRSVQTMAGEAIHGNSFCGVIEQAQCEASVMLSVHPGLAALHVDLGAVKPDLKRDVRYFLAQQVQPPPGVLMQEPEQHSHAVRITGLEPLR